MIDRFHVLQNGLNIISSVYILMCMGMNLVVPAPESAKPWTILYKTVLFFHFVVMVLKFTSLMYIDAIFDLLIFVFGCIALSHKNGYGLSQIQCYFYMTGFNFVWGIVRVSLWAAGVTMYSEPSYKYGKYVLATAIIGAVVVYFFAALASYKLYKHLMAAYREGEQAAFQQQGGAYAQTSAPQENTRSFAHTNNRQNRNMNNHRATGANEPSGFKAFSGQGHRLG